MSKTEIVEEGKYKFIIKRNIQSYRDEIIIHTYKIGGDYTDCINISYIYKNNKPIQAKIPHLLYESECAFGTFLERGSGTEIMIRTAIKYAYNDVGTIPIFEFDDDSHIDCFEKDMSTDAPRKPIKPLNLAYFYIAYHDKTWYEARFNAKMVNKEKYIRYRKSIEFLKEPSKKVGFIDFLQIIGQSLDSLDKIEYLEKLYNKTETYRDFFEAIPKKKRCEILYGWLNTFMNHYIGSVFSDRGWYIDVNHMNTNINSQIGGSSFSNNLKYRIFSYNKLSTVF